MTTKEICVIGASCVAKGHPSNCTENVSGSVKQTSSVDVTIEGTQIATKANAKMNFSSHAHKYSDNDDDGSKECHDNQTHNLDPDDSSLSSIMTVEGSPVYVKDTAVATDPGSGGDIDITDSNSSLGKTE